MKWNPFYAADPKLNKVRPEPGTSVLVTCLDKRARAKWYRRIAQTMQHNRFPQKAR